VAGSCECGDEPSGSCTTELVSSHKYVSMMNGLRGKMVHVVWYNIVGCG
jgi:hypothetical protein